MAEIDVLCADPDDAVRSDASAALGEMGMRTTTATTTDEAKDLISGDGVDCVITEYAFPDGTGMEVVEHLRRTEPDVPCILYTEASPAEIDTTRFEGMIVEYFGKGAPESDERLGMLVEDMVRHRAQVSYILPEDEEERLEALKRYDVSNVDVVETFDRLSELVASHFDVDAAFVGTIEQARENYIACHGADLDTADREDTVCTHAILEDDVTVIEDIRDDHRFKNNDLLDEFGIRFYAGANIDTPDGHTLGSLCLVDSAPRTMSDAERRELELFAAEVSEQLELRRRILAEGGDE